MKRSMRAARMERRHKRFGKATLSLVSLMDIFTILVFFLLVNSSDVQQMPNTKSIKLPQSIAEELPKDNLVVMVNAKQILVRGRPVADVQQVLDSDERKIPELKKELEYQASLMWDKDKLTDVEGAEITIMGDRAIPYKLVEKILATMAETPYKTIYFAVARKEKERS